MSNNGIGLQNAYVSERSKILKKPTFIFTFIFTLLFAVSSYATDKGKGNTWNDSFNKAKKTLEREVYTDHRITFYCGCEFDQSKQVKPCQNYTPKKTGERAKRVEWEHVVPAAHFGQSFKEWREGHKDCVDNKGKAFKGRNCASKVAIPYRYMESDLYNLVPAIGEVNGLRSNFRFDMISGEKRDFGACDMEIDSQARIAEPPERVRGDIARTYKYMNQAYPGHGIIGGSSKKLFDAWDKGDPVDAWECERCRRIEAIQGNENPVVKEACQKAGLWSGSASQGKSISESVSPEKTQPKAANGAFHGNTKSMVFHNSGCKNYECKNCTATFATRDDAIKAGYKPCGICKP